MPKTASMPSPMNLSSTPWYSKTASTISEKYSLRNVMIASGVIASDMLVKLRMSENSRVTRRRSPPSVISLVKSSCETCVVT